MSRLNATALMARSLIERFGAVAVDPSGGGTAVRLQTPSELVERCFDIAEKFYAQAERRGPVDKVPNGENP